MSDANMVIAGLTSFWLGTREINLAQLEQYYDGTQTVEMNGMLTSRQRNRADVTRFFKPINYLAALVDEPIGYLAHGKVRITSGGNKRLAAWAQEFHARRIIPKREDTVRWQGLYGECYAYLWTDREGSSRGLKLDVIPPIEGASRRVLADYGGQDPEELTRAVLYKRVPVDTHGGFDEYRITIDESRVLVERRRISRGMVGTITGGRWELVSDEPNPTGVLPVIPIFNPVPSDILNVIHIQDDLDKLHLDMRMAREYAGWPLLATDSDEPDEPVAIGPGRILYGGTFTRIEPASIESFLQERKSLLESMAKIGKSVTLLTEAGTDESGVALKFRQQSFLEKLQSKAQRLSRADELILHAAARILAVDSEMYERETRRLRPEDRPTPEELRDAEFDVVVEPALPADEKVQAEIAEIWDRIGFARETVFGKAGAENPAAEVEKADEEAARAVATARARLQREAGELAPEDDPLGDDEDEDEEEGS